MARNEKTYAGLRKRYEAWVEYESTRPERDRLRSTGRYEPPTREENPDMSRMVFAVIGVGIGAVLLALSAYAFMTANYWAGFERDGAQVGFTLVGFFLLVAGAGGIVATLNHNFRVLAKAPDQY